MTRKPKITFVGPIYSKIAHGKRAASLFNVLQDGGSILLTYANYVEAATARRALLADLLTYPVPTNKLLSAIQKAMQDVKAQEPPSVTEAETL
jgi:hypothetical protein